MKHHIDSLHVADNELLFSRVTQREKKRIGQKSNYLPVVFAAIVTVALVASVPSLARKTEIVISADNYFFNHPALKELAIAYRNVDWILI